MIGVTRGKPAAHSRKKARKAESSGLPPPNIYERAAVKRRQVVGSPGAGSKRAIPETSIRRLAA